jgi:threonine aldolase
VIDLRSDTVTRPTAAMREAMARAEVGDDVYGDDPTVNRLQERVAELLGTEAALFVPSGSMANQIALKIHTQPGDDVIIGEGAHNWLYESGAGGALAGVQFTFAGRGGLFGADDVRAAWKADTHHHAPSRLVCVENTHNTAGGRIWPRAQNDEVLAVARALELKSHLDGARLWNAAVATGRPERELAAGFDTVSVCLSKGLGAPVGSLLCGRKADMWRAHRVRKMYGGAMRQAGILAAAGLHALEHHRARLVDDHAHAQRLADGLAAGRNLRPQRPETNILLVDVEAPGPDAATLVERARAAGVLANAVGPRRLRLVTHLDVDAAACDRAAAILARASD